MAGNARQQRIVLRIRGRVQGVGYRVSARRMAAKLGIDAEPVNLPDGSVRIAVTGTPGRIAQFRAWCAEGPAAARVESVEEESRGGTMEDAQG